MCSSLEIWSSLSSFSKKHESDETHLKLYFPFPPVIINPSPLAVVIILGPVIGTGNSLPENKSANTLVVSILCYSNVFSQSHAKEK